MALGTIIATTISVGKHIFTGVKLLAKAAFTVAKAATTVIPKITAIAQKGFGLKTKFLTSISAKIGKGLAKLTAGKITTEAVTKGIKAGTLLAEHLVVLPYIAKKAIPNQDTETQRMNRSRLLTSLRVLNAASYGIKF